VLDPTVEPGALPSPAVEAPKSTLPFQRIGAFIEVVACSGFPSQVLIILVLRLFGLQPHTAAGQLSPAFVFTVSMLDAALVIGLILFFLRTHGERPRDVLIGYRPILREVGLGLLTVPAVFFLVVIVLAVVMTIAPSLHLAHNPLEDLMTNRRDAILFGIVAMVAGGVREETQRGFIVHRFDQYLGGGAIGVIVYSVFFGLGHVEQGIDAVLATGVLGAVWGALYLARRSIVAPMTSHAVFNLGQLVKYVALR
jgi:membrane protease YdiL (CAAX protease family)